jgi:hypothetical protein
MRKWHRFACIGYGTGYTQPIVVNINLQGILQALGE